MLKGAFSRFPENGKNISLQYSVYYNLIALSCVNSLMILLNLLGNGFVVFRYYQTRARQPVSNTLVFLLASFDFLQGAVAQPLFTSSYILKLSGILNRSLEEAADMTTCVLLGFSFIMVAIVLSTERLVAIVYPIHHRIYMRRKVLIYVTLTLFGVWTMINVILHLGLPPFQLFSLFYISIFILLPAGLIYSLTIYVKIFRVIRESTRIQSSSNFSMSSLLAIRPIAVLATSRNRNDAIEKDSGLNSGVNKADDDSSHDNGGPEWETEGAPAPRVFNKAQNAAQRLNLTTKERRTLYRMLCLVGVLYLMSIPILSAFTCYALEVSKKLFFNYLYPWAATIFFANGLINPYIYCHRNEHFRRRKARF